MSIAHFVLDYNIINSSHLEVNNMYKLKYLRESELLTQKQIAENICSKYVSQRALSARKADARNTTPTEPDTFVSAKTAGNKPL